MRNKIWILLFVVSLVGGMIVPATAISDTGTAIGYADSHDNHDHHDHDHHDRHHDGPDRDRDRDRIHW